MRPKRMPVFATGSSEYRGDGGSGFATLVRSMRCMELDAEIPVVVCNHPNGSIKRIADKLGIRFLYMGPPYDEAHYRKIFRILRADVVAFSGWLQIVRGGDPTRDFNIHPGPVPLTQGMCGKKLFQTVIQAFRSGRITHSEIVMHFMTDTLDDGAGIFFRCPVAIYPNDTWQSLQHRTKKIEHRWQPLIAQMLLDGKISWDGRTAGSLTGKIILTNL